MGEGKGSSFQATFGAPMADIETTRQEFRRKGAAFRSDVVEKMSQLATAAFGLVAALAWNSAIQKVFEVYYPAGDKSQILPLVGYALGVTLIAVLVILIIGRAAARLKGKADAAAADAAKRA